MYTNPEVVLDLWTRHQRSSARGGITVEIGERVAAAAVLCVTMPVLLISVLITAVLSRRPPLIKHARIGRNNQTISVWKLRTMWNHAQGEEPVRPEPPNPARCFSGQAKFATDPRITSRFAAMCRRFSIDELPQLWNVVRGEMALVGPRPLTRCELELFYANDAAEVLSVKPGLTGLWQIRGRNRLSYRRRRRLDLILIRKWSPRLYFSILLITLPKVLLGRDAW